MDGEDADLHALAALHGVHPTYHTAAGDTRTADPDAVLAVLRVLGAPVEGRGDVPDALRAARARRETALAPPVAVAWSGRPASLTVRRSGGERDAPVRCRLTLEDGATRAWEGRIHPAASDEVEGRTVETGHLELPGDLPPGHHDLRMEVAGRSAVCRLVVAPPRAWAPEDGRRGWGIFLPLYALRTGRDAGVGDLTDLAALGRWVTELGGEAVGTLPILAAFLDAPYEPSPYAPVSRLFWNELYLDPEKAPGWDAAAEARELLASPPMRDARARLRGTARVDYREVARTRRAVLERLVGSFAPAGEPLPDPLARWADARPEALAYARFRAVGEREGRGWRAWPEALRDGALGPGDGDEAAVRYHLYAQWAMERTLEAGAAGDAGLYLDLPLGTHADGFDTWRHRELFAEGASAGAPPDPFFAGGQDWGIPPLHPGRLRDDRHGYWAASLAHLMGASSLLRLDHVMGLHRLYWVPRGFPATEGVYVRYPAEELYAVLCLASHRQRCEVVGEDLGTVPDEVREAMERHRLRRMYVLPFELGRRDGAPRLAPVPPSAVASVDTHDMPPWAGFWDAADVTQRVADGQIAGERAADELQGRGAFRADAAEALAAEGEPVGGPGAGAALAPALRFLAASPARLVLVSLEDLWGETESQNRPGTAGEENWTRRAAHDLEAVRAMEGPRELLAEVDRLRREGCGGEGDAPGLREPPAPPPREAGGA